MGHPRAVLTGCALFALCAWANAESPASAPGSKPPMEAYCDRFAGAAREQCLGEPHSRTDRPGDARGLTGTCDGLPVPARQRCLQEGGTVEVDTPVRSRERPAAPAGSK